MSKMNHNIIKSLIAEHNERALFLDGFDEAIIGYTRNSSSEVVCVYNIGRILEILVGEHNMTQEEAIEYYDFNIEPSYMGEHSPIYMDLLVKTVI
jgi:hypothetical protein